MRGQFEMAKFGKGQRFFTVEVVFDILVRWNISMIWENSN
jgi:hypothetical protein